MQRPLMNRSTLFLASILTEEELNHMRKVASDHFDQIMEVLKAMPRQLLLIIRCVKVHMYWVVSAFALKCARVYAKGSVQHWIQQVLEIRTELHWALNMYLSICYKEIKKTLPKKKFGEQSNFWSSLICSNML